MSRAVVLEGPRRITLERRERRPPGPGQVRIRTLHSGISAGTELTAYRGTSPMLRKRRDPATRLFHDLDAPRAAYPVRDLGYEEVGVVEELGRAAAEAGTPAVGDRVYGTWGHRMHHLMDAAEARARRLPDELPALAGIFSHIGSTALNGVHDADARIGETAAVFGLGVPGQIAAQLLTRSGLTVVGIDPLPARRATACRLSAVQVALSPDEAAIAERIRDLTDGRGADVAIEASGSVPALHEAVRSVAYAGRVVALGFYQGGAGALALGEEFHHSRVALVSSQISGVAPERSYRWDRARLARELMRLQADGTLDLVSLVTHRLPLSRAAEAFRLVDERPDEVLQVVLDMDAGDEGSDA